MLKAKAQSKNFHWYQWLTTLLLLALVFSMSATPASAGGNPPEEPRASTGGVSAQAATAPTNSAGIATADPNGAHATYAWPIAFNQLGWSMESLQNYGSTSADSYFHHGIDMVTNNSGTPVYAVSGGQVVNIQNYQPGQAIYWEVAILDPQGYVWQFHHIDSTTIPQAIKDAYTAWQANHTTGGFISAGTLIGKNVLWPVTTFGYVFNHIHLNILAKGDIYLNPMEFLTSFNDTSAPQIQAIGLLQNHAVVSGTTVSGSNATSYGLYVRARDLVLSSVFYLPPYKIEYALDGGAWKTTWQFHTFPGGSNDYTYVNQFYVYPPSCGSYTCRDYYIDLGFTTSGDIAWPSTSGSHTIQVRVSDYSGNTATSSWSWTVAGAPVTVFSDNFTNAQGWVRNPSATDTATSGLWERGVPGTTNSGGAKQIAAYSASYDLVTGAAAGANANSNDVDGGVTSMRSPNIALPSGKTISLSLKYYFAHASNSTSVDYLKISVVGSTTKTPVQVTGNSKNLNASWSTLAYNLSSFAGQTVYLLIQAADASPDSLVEAGVDDVVITAQ